jgi:hypothetical protein
MKRESIIATSRAQAKAKGLPRFSTGRPCRHGHVAERFTASGGCIPCQARFGNIERKESIERRRAGRPGQAAAEGGGWFVYVLRIVAPDAGEYVKVGMAERVKQRVSGMQAGCPFPLEVMFTVGGLSPDGARVLEFDTHALLMPHHERGEWFRCSVGEAIAAVKYAVLFG